MLSEVVVTAEAAPPAVVPPVVSAAPESPVEVTLVGSPVEPFAPALVVPPAVEFAPLSLVGAPDASSPAPRPELVDEQAQSSKSGQSMRMASQ